MNNFQQPNNTNSMQIPELFKILVILLQILFKASLNQWVIL